MRPELPNAVSLSQFDVHMINDRFVQVCCLFSNRRASKISAVEWDGMSHPALPDDAQLLVDCRHTRRFPALSQIHLQQSVHLVKLAGCRGCQI